MMRSNIAALLLDLGDTIMDESTEIKDASATTQSAQLIPGMADALRQLHAQGLRLALVADSRPNTPLNVLKQHGLIDLFEHLSISEVVGSSKPDAGIFYDALNALGIAEEDYSRVLMVGNNLERDILGANVLGLRSVFMHTNETRRTAALSRLEYPSYTVTNAQELLDLVAALSVQVDAAQPPLGLLDAPDAELAARYAPLICFDDAEPFLPLAVGYSVLRSEEHSPSFRRRILHAWRPDWTLAIEYAIWWDWDIQHLYELEHIWSFIGAQGQLVWVEASSHGDYASMICEDGTFPHEGSHPLVYSQPGKHAFAPNAHFFEMVRDYVAAETQEHAGSAGVLVKDEYVRQIVKTAEDDARAAAWLCQKAFAPSGRYGQKFAVQAGQLVPWPVLSQWIPLRVNWWLERLRSGQG